MYVVEVSGQCYQLYQASLIMSENVILVLFAAIICLNCVITPIFLSIDDRWLRRCSSLFVDLLFDLSFGGRFQHMDM